jgi:hypothetical protein
MRSIKNIVWCLSIAFVCAAAVTPVGANQPINSGSNPQVAEESPCTEYSWQGKALVQDFKGELREIIGHGTVCANSRDEARKLATEAMFKHASRFGRVITYGADLAG